MQKQFTVSIPDERWIDSWDSNLTLTKTYTGPSKVYAPINLELNSLVGVYFDSSPTQGPYANTDNYNLYEIDADTDTAIAQLVQETVDDEYKLNYIREFEDETLHDGSIYAKTTNPMVSDYYRLRYDTLTSKIVLEAIFNDNWRIPQLGVVNNKLEVLNYNKTNIAFSETMLAKITAAIAQLETYKATIVNARNWKYDTFDMSEIPQISKSVEQALKPIPVQEPTQPELVPEPSNE